MSRITICLHSGTTMLDRFIRWQTRGLYSHASIILPDGRHVEARPFKGVMVHPVFKPKAGETVDSLWVEASNDQVASMTQFLLEQEGLGYDYLAVLCFLTRSHPGKASPTRWFCSEIIVDALKTIGIELFRATHAFEVSPVLLGRSPILRP